jgi:hypothetical protein
MEESERGEESSRGKKLGSGAENSGENAIKLPLPSSPLLLLQPFLETLTIDLVCSAGRVGSGRNRKRDGQRGKEQQAQKQMQWSVHRFSPVNDSLAK